MNCINQSEVKRIIALALKEDIGKKDITSELVIPVKKRTKAVIVAKDNCVICGLDIAAGVFNKMDKGISFECLAREGQYVKKGKIIARLEGNARAILTAERVALNFLSFLSGIATKTSRYVKVVRPYKVKILDTRKTIPGLRRLEKYAVRTGGGANHRMTLDEMVLVKDNHLADNNKNITEKIRAQIPKRMEIEIEVENLTEFKDALNKKPDIIMLDNMSVDDIKKAIKIRNSLSTNTRQTKPKLEASGGITLKNVRKFAAAGVDMISIGALTHSVKSADMSLEFVNNLH